MNERILHIATWSAWRAAQENGEYAADSLSGQGFIHCSKVDQVLRVADDFYAGVSGLAMLVIDPARLQPELRWEPGTDLATELFPHIYGPLNLDAVLAVFDLKPGEDGKFHLLPDLDSLDR